MAKEIRLKMKKIHNFQVPVTLTLNWVMCHKVM